MSAVDQSQTDAIVALLARVAGALERSEAVHVRAEAVSVAMLAELRRLRNRSSFVDLDELLPVVWGQFGDRPWDVRALADLGLIAEVNTRRVGQALGRLTTDGGRCGDMVLAQVSESNKGWFWCLTLL